MRRHGVDSSIRISRTVRTPWYERSTGTVTQAGRPPTSSCTRFIQLPPFFGNCTRRGARRRRSGRACPTSRATAGRSADESRRSSSAGFPLDSEHRHDQHIHPSSLDQRGFLEHAFRLESRAGGRAGVAGLVCGEDVKLRSGGVAARRSRKQEQSTASAPLPRPCSSSRADSNLELGTPVCVMNRVKLAPPDQAPVLLRPDREDPECLVLPDGSNHASCSGRGVGLKAASRRRGPRR